MASKIKFKKCPDSSLLRYKNKAYRGKSYCWQMLHGVRPEYETTVTAQLVHLFHMLLHVVCLRICYVLTCPYQQLLLQTKDISQFTLILQFPLFNYPLSTPLKLTVSLTKQEGQKLAHNGWCKCSYLVLFTSLPQKLDHTVNIPARRSKEWTLKFPVELHTQVIDNQFSTILNWSFSA